MITVVAVVVLAGPLSVSASSGVLLPWSPVRPWHTAHGYAAGTVYAPDGHAPAADYRALDSIASMVERFHGLRFRRRVRVVLARDWRQFNRGTFIAWDGAPRPVLGAALQTGDVVYMSPLAHEPGRRPARILAHELAHALLYQHVSLRESFALREAGWLLEGLAVRAGNAVDYLSDAAFDSVAAAHPEWVFAPGDAPPQDRIPAETAGPFVLTTYRRFIDDLVERHGAPRLRRLVQEVVVTPADASGAFARVYGRPLTDAGADFVAAIRGMDGTEPIPVRVGAGSRPSGSR